MSSGRLDNAPSKADVLADLCNKLNFDPDAASALHKQLYRQKLDSLLEKKRLTGTAERPSVPTRLQANMEGEWPPHLCDTQEVLQS